MSRPRNGSPGWPAAKNGGAAPRLPGLGLGLFALALLMGPRVVEAAADMSATTAAAQTLQILYSADLDGRFAVPTCPDAANAAQAAGGDLGRDGADYPRLVATLAAARDTAEAHGDPRPLALLGGNLAAPDLLGRVFLEDGAAGIYALAALLRRGRFDAIALGHHDLSLQPAELRDLVRALVDGGTPVVATNLSCVEPRRDLCAVVRPFVIVRRGLESIGVLATLSPSVLPGIAPALRAGWSLGDPLAAVQRAMGSLRARGVTRVILMTQGPRDARALQEVDALQRSLASPPAATVRMNGTPRPDGIAEPTAEPALILAGGLADASAGDGANDGGDGAGARALRLMLRDGAPPVVGSVGGASGLSRVRLPPRGDIDATIISNGASGDASSADPPVAGPPDVEARRLLAPVIQRFCRRYQVPAAPAPIQGALSRTAFVTYAMEVMRRRAHAEIALLNRDAIKRAPFPLKGTITLAALHQALPYPAAVGVAVMTGAAIDAALGQALANPKLASVGLARASPSPASGLTVNGRALDKARNYRVATIAFVAAGGDGILSPGALPWRPLEGAPDLRQAVEDFLRSDTAREDGDPGVDPRTDFGPDPSTRTLLVGLTDVGLDLADTRIANTPAYGDAQLARANQRVLKGEGTALAQLRHPQHEADSRLNLKYGWTRTQPVNAPAVSDETTDLITFTTVYNYRGLRSRGAAGRRDIPDPYVRAGVESEFTRPDVSPTQPRAFHHLELTNTAGALFALSPALRVRGGAGVRKELLTSTEPLGRWRPLFEAGGSLTPVALTSFGALSVKLEGLVDYNFVDPAGVREHQIRGNAKLSVPLLPLLFITAGVDVFAVQRQRQGWASSYDTTVGIRVHLDAAHQWL